MIRDSLRAARSDVAEPSAPAGRLANGTNELNGAVRAAAGRRAGVDARPEGSGDDVRWHSDARSVAVPRFSVAEGTIHTTTRESSVGCARTGPFDRFALPAIGAETGDVLEGHHIGAGVFSGAGTRSASSHPTGCSTRAPSPASCASSPPREVEHSCPAPPANRPGGNYAQLRVGEPAASTWADGCGGAGGTGSGLTRGET